VVGWTMLFVLICYGLTQILVHGHILEPIRPKAKFFHCSMCMGFWAGIAVFLGFWFCGLQLFPNVVVGSFLFGCLSSGTSYVLCQIFGDDGIKINLN